MATIRIQNIYFRDLVGTPKKPSLQTRSAGKAKEANISLRIKSLKNRPNTLKKNIGEERNKDSLPTQDQLTT